MGHNSWFSLLLYVQRQFFNRSFTNLREKRSAVHFCLLCDIRWMLQFWKFSENIRILGTLIFTLSDYGTFYLAYKAKNPWLTAFFNKESKSNCPVFNIFCLFGLSGNFYLFVCFENIKRCKTKYIIFKENHLWTLAIIHKTVITEAGMCLSATNWSKRLQVFNAQQQRKIH